MSRTRIKFCGIRRAQDAEIAVSLGVDALGFVLVPESRRYLSPEKAAAIRRRLPPLVTIVALFKDADAGFVQAAIDTLQPELLQFHGAEDAGFCTSFGLPYVKAVAMQGNTRLPTEVRRHPAARALLLDAHAPGGMGGQGTRFDWSQVPSVRKPLILAGGLTPQNVGQGMKALRPYAVDVSSGIESKPGIKDPHTMRAFVTAVRRADEKLK